MKALQIYAQLARKNLTWSLRDCSQFVLGMNPSYLAQRGDRELSTRASLHLFRHLWQNRRYFLAMKVARAILWADRSDA